ncbi:acyl-CoA dehydrogenase, partial [Streptomyces sp. ms191]|uniref:acyl-CoA dehydrogenase family protein n=1 Tax=Streptomyces sp. ms191 TaxID=1827978 RepID=UPI001313CB74
EEYGGRGASIEEQIEEYGGRGASIEEQIAFHEEYALADAPARVNHIGEQLLGPTLVAHGTPEQKARFLPPIRAVTELWCQGYSEPGAGSDLAGVRTRATLDGDAWVVHGQKIWSSRAAFADRAFGIFRTDPAADRPHRGLTYLMFDLRAPGVTVRPIGRLDGKPAFAELFLDEVFVPDADVIGEPGQGWRIAMSTTGNERGLMLRSP